MVPQDPTVCLCACNIDPGEETLGFKKMCINVFLHVCLCTTYVPPSCRGQKRTSDAPEPELNMVRSHHVGVENEPRYFGRTANAFKH